VIDEFVYWQGVKKKKMERGKEVWEEIKFLFPPGLFFFFFGEILSSRLQVSSRVYTRSQLWRLSFNSASFSGKDALA